MLMQEFMNQSGRKQQNAFYSVAKCGTGGVDEVSAICYLSKNSRYWPVTLFFTLMNVTVVNAEIIYDAYANKVTVQRNILV
jgi:hypothetical protein